MTNNFIKRTLIATFVLALASLLWLWFDGQLVFGIGMFMGAAWGSINLYFIKHLIEQLIAAKKSLLNICFLLGVKFPLLYSTGYAMLTSEVISSHALVYGFTLFLITVLGIGASTLLQNNAEQASERGK